jgi:fatty-acyl-CoA synthase
VKKFDPKIFLEIVETSRGSIVIFAVPTLYYMIMKSDRFKEIRFDNVEWMLSGGAPIDRKIMEEYWSKGVRMAQGYGITEGGPNNLTMPIYDLSLEDIKVRWKSVGKPFAYAVLSYSLDIGKEAAKQLLY